MPIKRAGTSLPRSRKLSLKLTISRRCGRRQSGRDELDQPRMDRVPAIHRSWAPTGCVRQSPKYVSRSDNVFLARETRSLRPLPPDQPHSIRRNVDPAIQLLLFKQVECRFCKRDWLVLVREI